MIQNWFYPWDLGEWALLLAFLALSVLYIYRTHRIARILGKRAARIWLKLGLRLAYCFLAGIALLGPSLGDSQRSVEVFSKDIYLAIDLSNSMLARDLPPSRLEKLKYELKKLTRALASDRFGIITFTGDAFLQCPLTRDQSALDLFIQTLDPQSFSDKSTDLAAPLRLAWERFQSQRDTRWGNQSKILVLASDGEDFGIETDLWIQAFRQKDIRIMTLGVGTLQGGTIPRGSQTLEDDQGQEVLTRLRYNTLEEMAQQTRGAYFEISRNRNEIESLIDSLRKIRGDRQDIQIRDWQENKYAYFLGIAWVLLILDFALPLNVIRL